jgi:pectinesterase
LIFIVCLTTLSAFAQKRIVVTQDGSGSYTTVSAAINAIPVNNKKPVMVFIKKGIYKEKLYLDSSKSNVTFIGEDKFETILTYDDHTGKKTAKGEVINTRTSYSFLVQGNNFRAENLTIKNDAGFTAGQAVGLEVQGDKAIFINCRIIGNQDILFTSGENSRQYYEGCYIEGTTDFIFGAATVWFEKCHIHSKKDSHVTAASTPQSHVFGYVFNECILTGDTSLHKVSLGRPWRPYASVTYLHCYIGPHIFSQGWAAWNNNDNHKTARYAEYRNYGPGAATEQRVSWSRQLSADEAATYTIRKVFHNWQPQSK